MLSAHPINLCFISFSKPFMKTGGIKVKMWGFSSIYQRSSILALLLMVDLGFRNHLEDWGDGSVGKVTKDEDMNSDIQHTCKNMGVAI